MGTDVESGMKIKKLLVQLLSLVGLSAASYALYVENQLSDNPFYKPACETSWGSCSTVFKSEYRTSSPIGGSCPRGMLWISLLLLQALSCTACICSIAHPSHECSLSHMPCCSSCRSEGVAFPATCFTSLSTFLRTSASCAPPSISPTSQCLLSSSLSTEILLSTLSHNPRR